MCFSKHKEKHMDKREEWCRKRVIERFRGGDPEWYLDHSRKPIQTTSRTSVEIEEIVKYVRLELHN